MSRTTNQPTWDFLAGAEASPQQLSRTAVAHNETSTKPSAIPIRADLNNEELRVQLRTLQYEVETLKQERELSELHHQQEIHNEKNLSAQYFKQAEEADLRTGNALARTATAVRTYEERQDRLSNERTALEKKAREFQDEARSLKEDLEEARAELASQERQYKHASAEIEQKSAALSVTVEDLQQDLENKVSALQSTQQKLKHRDAEVGELENEVLRLKAQTGDADTLALIKKELSEQVTYIKKLEGINRDQSAEIKQFRKNQKSIEVVEEEKHSLETRLRVMDDMQKTLSEAQLQKRILEDEKKNWLSYLETEASGDDDLRYETPEEMAKAFLQERLEKIDLLEKLGAVQPQISVKDANIQSLEDDKARLGAELEQLRTAGSTGKSVNGVDSKAQARLERQKNLITKEVEYLRAQMKTFEAEEAEFTPGQIDEARAKRIHELEDMVEQYRTEVQTLQANLSQLELQPRPSEPQSPKKRSREDDLDSSSDERLGELRRKMRSLTDDFDKLQQRNKLVEAELKASITQIARLRESSRTRVLELRNNPTAAAEAIKLSSITTLREENAALLAQLEGSSASKVVPSSTLDNLRQQLADAQALTAQTEKKTLRLKQIWSTKSLEFREAVCSLLGWRLDFQPNGRVKATSILYPTTHHNGEELENSIVFDGENGTMKVSGGTQSLFAGEIRSLIEFWVEGRRDIPCFLAACTLEFYEKTTRALKM